MEAKLNMLKSGIVRLRPTDGSKKLIPLCFYYTNILIVMCVWVLSPSGKHSVTPKEAERIHKAHNESTRLWRKRKRMVCYIILSLAPFTLCV